MVADVEPRQLLHGTNFATAQLQEHYPFGINRCLRKVWVETADKGAKKGQQRFVSCTTKQAFNEPYTQHVVNKRLFMYDTSIGAPIGLLRAAAPSVLDAMEPEQRENVLGLYKLDAPVNPAIWNKPKYGTYNRFVALYKRPQSDQRMFVQVFHLSMYSTPDAFAAFRMILEGDLNGNERLQYQLAHDEARRYNARDWQLWDNLMMPEQVVKAKDYLATYDTDYDPGVKENK